jgi:hypothetical protein
MVRIYDGVGSRSAQIKRMLLGRPDLQLDEFREAIRDTIGIRVSRASMCHMRREWVSH